MSHMESTQEAPQEAPQAAPDLGRTLGIHAKRQPGRNGSDGDLVRYVNLKLAANGLPAAMGDRDREVAEVAKGLLDSYQEKTRLLEDYRCPADARIEAFLKAHFADLKLPHELRLPSWSLELDRHG